MIWLKLIELILLSYIAVCGAVIFGVLKEFQRDIDFLIHCKASNVADKLIKDGYITKKKAKV